MSSYQGFFSLSSLLGPQTSSSLLKFYTTFDSLSRLFPRKRDRLLRGEEFLRRDCHYKFRLRLRSPNVSFCSFHLSPWKTKRYPQRFEGLPYEFEFVIVFEAKMNSVLRANPVENEERSFTKVIFPPITEEENVNSVFVRILERFSTIGTFSFQVIFSVILQGGGVFLNVSKIERLFHL